MGNHNESRYQNFNSGSIDDAALAEKRVTTLMGDKVEPRRKWIEQNVKFNLEEDGSILDNTKE